MAQPEHLGQVERIRSFVGREDNLVMWAQLYIRPDGAVAGWLMDSWSEHGAPYWNPKLHWLDKNDDKLYHVFLSMGYAGGSSMNLRGQDTEIDPKRAKFVRKMMEKWELEWLEDEAKRLGG